MPYDGSGNFQRVRRWVNDASAKIKIKADLHDSEDDNIAAGLSNAITKDGQTQPTANIPMNGKRITSLGEPVNDTDACTKGFAIAIKTFSTGIEITGTDENGRLKFTGPSGLNGVQWAGADLSWLARMATVAPDPVTKNRLVLNDKADGSGTDVVVINDNGDITTLGRFDTSGLIQSNAGRLLASNPAGATIGLHDTDQHFATGFWVDGPNQQLWFGSLDGAGNPIGGWGAFRSTGLQLDSITTNLNLVVGTSLSVGTSISAGGSISTLGNISARGDNNFGLFFSGSSRVYGFAAGYYIGWNSATGDMVLQSAGGNRWLSRNSDGYFICPTAIIAPSGLNPPSDARIKNILGPYDTGSVLDRLANLQPVRFTHKGNSTSEPPPEGESAPYSTSFLKQMADNQTEVVGFLAQELEAVFPDLVSKGPSYIDGVQVDDFRSINETKLIYVLFNAVKELSVRVRELEGAP